MGDADRGVKSVVGFAQRDAEMLREMVEFVNDGTLALEVTRRTPLADLPALHSDEVEGGP